MENWDDQNAWCIMKYSSPNSWWFWKVNQSFQCCCNWLMENFNKHFAFMCVINVPLFSKTGLVWCTSITIYENSTIPIVLVKVLKNMCLKYRSIFRKVPCGMIVRCLPFSLLRWDLIPPAHPPYPPLIWSRFTMTWTSSYMSSAKSISGTAATMSTICLLYTKHSEGRTSENAVWKYDSYHVSRAFVWSEE